MDTITSSADISFLFNKGVRHHTPYLTLIVLTDEHGRSLQKSGRVAFIAGKKQGNAVWRNAAKRRMREICRVLGGPWEGRDVIFLAKKKLVSVPYQQVLSACYDALRKAGLETS